MLFELSRNPVRMSWLVENIHLSELRHKAVTAGTLASICYREEPDLLRDHRAEFKDEADIAKAEWETILSVSKTSSAGYPQLWSFQLHIAGYFSVVWPTIRVFSHLQHISSNRHANYVLGTTQSPN